jgi:imidazolonepropionase-like amidohydrolase
MAKTLFSSASIWIGTGAPPFVGDVLIDGARIAAVSSCGNRLQANDAEVIEASGCTLMPGLVEGHAHISFGNATRNSDLGDIPTEEHLLLTMRNAALLLDHGFTSAYSAASAKLRLDLVIRNEINAGRLAGPRIRAASPEITVTGGLGDENTAYRERSGFGFIADGPAEITKFVRYCVREGVDNIKINVSGDDFVGAKGCMTVMEDGEISAAVQTAHAFQRRVNCHARASEAVKRAVRNGVDVIYHCESADEEALDMLEAAKDRLFVGPAIGLIHNSLHEAAPYGISYQDACDMGLAECMAASQRTYEKIRKRKIRVVIGGDYGFAWTPQGTNARDIEHFVKLFGYSPSEALQCATRIGAEIMGMGDELGLVREGYLADLLLVTADPLADVSVLQHAKNLAVIMKDGYLHKNATRNHEPRNIRTQPRSDSGDFVGVPRREHAETVD